MIAALRGVAALLVLCMVTTACSSTEGLLGKELYEQSCATCHRADGTGGTGPAVGAGSNAVQLTDEQIAGVIRVGPGVMPGFSRLTDEQVTSLVDYIRELQGEDGG